MASKSTLFPRKALKRKSLGFVKFIWHFLDNIGEIFYKNGKSSFTGKGKTPLFQKIGVYHRAYPLLKTELP